MFALAKGHAILLVLLQGRVARLHRSGKTQVRQGVLMGAADPGVARQGGQPVKRGQHLGRGAFEEPAAAAREQGVAAEQQGCAIDIAGPEGNMACRMSGDIEHGPSNAQCGHGVAIVQRDEGLGDGLARRAPDGGPRGFTQFGHACGVVRMVVRD